jgi:hypothetical protein
VSVEANSGREELNMATWKRLTDIGKSLIEIDLDTIAFMCSNGKGTEIHFNSGQTLTVRESPEAVARRPSSDATQALPRQP